MSVIKITNELSFEHPKSYSKLFKSKIQQSLHSSGRLTKSKKNNNGNKN